MEQAASGSGVKNSSVCNGVTHETIISTWEIYPGDTGTAIGNDIYDAVFNKDTLLPMELISPAPPASDTPYIDTP